MADTGTFKNVVLDKLCKVYQWNGLEVADAGYSTPCGITNNGTEIFQITNRIIANELETVNIKGTNVAAKSLDVRIANIEQIITPMLNAEYIEVSEQLEVKGDSFLRGDLDVTGNTTMTGNLNLSGILTGNESYFTILNSTDATISKSLDVGENATIENNLTVNETTTTKNLTVTDEMRLNIRATEGGSCSDVGLLATTTIGDLLACVSGKWKKQNYVEPKVPEKTTGTWRFVSSNCGNSRAPGHTIFIYRITGTESCEIGTKSYTYVPGKWNQGCGVNTSNTENYVCK
ncbi:hypothetical protein ABLB26_10235 [Vibrio parahaemolyticus]